MSVAASDINLARSAAHMATQLIFSQHWLSDFFQAEPRFIHFLYDVYSLTADSN